MLTYPKPGRGAWRITGGLLPAKPGSTSRVGYYRLATGTEIPVGAGWIERGDRSHDAEAVSLGVQAIQALSGATVDGWFGRQSDERVRLAQTRLKIEVDGIVGPGTMRALLSELIKDVAGVTDVPVALIGGLLTHESGLDPAAVGVNGQDHGLAQINLGAHGDSVSLVNALDPSFAIHWSAEDLAEVHDVWQGRTKADPWDIAIAHHNSPLLAKRWATTGVPPVQAGRDFQIEEYVTKVKAAW